MNTIQEVCEVQIRYNPSYNINQRPTVTNPTDVPNLIRNIPEMRENIQYKELSYCIYMNQAANVLGILKISEGGLTQTPVDIRIILQGALLLNATRFIFVHNHPSGNKTPSEQDIQLTNRLKKAADIMDTKLTDSIIITADDYYSFIEEGMLFS